MFFELARRAVSAALDGVSVIFLFALPLFALGWFLQRRRTRLKAERLDPFTELPLRPPGESLRLKIEELSESFDSTLVIMVLVSAGSAMTISAAPAAQKPFLGVSLGAITLCAYVWGAVKIVRVQRLLWDHRLGFTGERVVGEELNQLLVGGIRVFHDVPFERFNIDHVLVGPAGVYAVETKSVRKKAAIKGLERATVYSDGTALRFPTATNLTFTAQARRNAATLGEWLSKSTGEPVTVNPILTLPGWRVERTATGEVNVLRPDEIKRSFPSKPKQPLTPEQIQRIAYQLTERCRLQPN